MSETVLHALIIAGSVLLGLSCVLASRAGSLVEFQLAFGVLQGVAMSAFFAPVMAATAASFERRRNLAVSLVSAGVGVWAADSCSAVKMDNAINAD